MGDSSLFLFFTNAIKRCCYYYYRHYNDDVINNTNSNIRQKGNISKYHGNGLTGERSNTSNWHIGD